MIHFRHSHWLFSYQWCYTGQATTSDCCCPPAPQCIEHRPICRSLLYSCHLRQYHRISQVGGDPKGSSLRPSVPKTPHISISKPMGKFASTRNAAKKKRKPTLSWVCVGPENPPERSLSRGGSRGLPTLPLHQRASREPTPAPLPSWWGWWVQTATCSNTGTTPTITHLSLEIVPTFYGYGRRCSLLGDKSPTQKLAAGSEGDAVQDWLIPCFLGWFSCPWYHMIYWKCGDMCPTLEELQDIIGCWTKS